jgi:16S rRNA (guanine527-N7)-methyltransferase
LPGIPLAIARPERAWRLIEPRERRAAFLEEVVRELDLDCQVVVSTAEEAAGDRRFAGAHVLTTARALAVPGVALTLLLPLTAPGGVAAVFIGSEAQVPQHAEEWQEGLAIVRV